MIERKIVEEKIPEIMWIKNPGIREKTIDTWIEAVKVGGWSFLEEIPFTLSFENSGTLVDHARRVTMLVKHVADARREKINHDFLVAGAILHDIGKALEYTKTEDGSIFVNREVERHPISGSKLAEKCGLPKEVVHIIAAHSHEGDKMDRSIEAVIVHHCDFIDFEIMKKTAEEEL
jgi:putative nucleotidyltransferase with HDIG domain